MKVTECLNAEHGVFLTQLGVLETMVRENAAAAELRAVTLAIASTVELHRGAEEEILYPAILRAFGQDFPPIQVMVEEHAQIERFIEGVRSSDANLPEMVQGFIDVLRQHIAKEINVLFPMAEQRIEAADLEQMTQECVEHYHRAAGVTVDRPPGGGTSR